jgi:hypothetical protein
LPPATAPPIRPSALPAQLGQIHIGDAEKGILETIWLLVTALICVPLATMLPGGNAVLGYLAGGAILGPYGMGVIHDPTHVSSRGAGVLCIWGG